MCVSSELCSASLYLDSLGDSGEDDLLCVCRAETLKASPAHCRFLFQFSRGSEATEEVVVSLHVLRGLMRWRMKTRLPAAVGGFTGCTHPTLTAVPPKPRVCSAATHRKHEPNLVSPELLNSGKWKSESKSQLDLKDLTGSFYRCSIS